MKENSVIPPVDSIGDSYDNALFEKNNGLYKAEMIYLLKHQWEGLEDVELETLNWVYWFHTKRLDSSFSNTTKITFV